VHICYLGDLLQEEINIGPLVHVDLASEGGRVLDQEALRVALCRFLLDAMNQRVVKV
jgi:hypothetical protein